MTMLYAGLRPAEVKALDIDKSVDLKQGVIRLTDFVHLDGSNHYKVTERGKTDLAAREIPIFAPLREALKDRHGLLIPSASGKQVSVRAWRTVWDSYVSDMEAAINGMQKRWYRRTREHKAILAEAGKLRAEGRDADADAVEAKIPPWIPFTVRPYDLRHSFAAWCRDNHVELKITEEQIWKNYEYFLKAVLPAAEDNTASRFRKLLPDRLQSALRSQSFPSRQDLPRKSAEPKSSRWHPDRKQVHRYP